MMSCDTLRRISDRGVLCGWPNYIIHTTWDKKCKWEDEFKTVPCIFFTSNLLFIYLLRYSCYIYQLIFFRISDLFLILKKCQFNIIINITLKKKGLVKLKCIFHDSHVCIAIFIIIVIVIVIVIITSIY